MLAGHLAVGLIGKRVEPKLSLGTLMLACLLCDLLWCVFMIAGLEQVRFKPGFSIVAGTRAVDALEAVQISYSHSLVMTAVWAALLALAYFYRRRNRRGSLVLFAAVLSHWLLDFISHPPDMPLLPGANPSRYGLGLWNSASATLLVEGAFWIVAIFLYVRASPSPNRTRAGALLFWPAIALLTVVWIGNIAGPPPQDPSLIGFSSLTFFALTVAWSYWMNRRAERDHNQKL